MSLQLIYQGVSAIVFPEFAPGGGGQGTAQQLRRLFWSTPGHTVVGLFIIGLNATTDLDLFNQNYSGRYQLLRIWRDGTTLNLSTNVQQYGVLIEAFQKNHTVVQTTDGRVARGLSMLNPFDVIITTQKDAPSGLYACDALWPNDVFIPGDRVGDVTLIEPQRTGIVNPTFGTAVTLVHYTSTQTVRIVEQPGSTTRFEVNYLMSVATWAHPRDLLYIDASTIAATFMQNSAGLTLDEGKPALIRVFDVKNVTSTGNYVLLFEETLPASDTIATYDPINGLVYSTERFAGAVLRTSYLRRAPSTLSIPTLVNASALREQTNTDISVLVQDGLGSVMSSVLVQWGLGSMISGGTFVSQFSRTNASGIATVTYVGPPIPTAPASQVVCAAVTTVEDI